MPRSKSTSVEPEPDLIPLVVAARRLGISAKTLYNRAYEGHIRHFEFRKPGGERARIAFDPRDIEAEILAAERPAISAGTTSTRRAT